LIENYRPYRIFWGDSHTNVHGKDLKFPPLTKKRLRRIMEAAEEHLDFLMIAYYPFEWYSRKGLIIESCGHRDRFLKDWSLVQEAVAEANKPEDFVAFLGYEWHGNRRKYGDHNIYYLKDYEPLDGSWTLPELYENLRRTEAMVIPHHTGYQVGERGKDWSLHDEELSPLVEIYSSHGSSEGCDAPLPLEHNLSMGPGVCGGAVQDGLKRGYKFGIIASGDNHNDFAGVWGNGLMAVFARDLTRESLWEAFQSRRVYGVTGDRIELYFSINGRIMGEIFDSERPAKISVEAIGSHAIDRVEIIRNGSILYTYCHSGRWSLPGDGNSIRAKLRIQCGWGPGGPYRFRKIEPKRWNGSLGLSEGRIISVEPCYTYFGQEVRQVSERECRFRFTCQPRVPLDPLLAQHHRANFQGAVFEVEAGLDCTVTVKADSAEVRFSLEDALRSDRLIALTEESRTMIHEEFGLRPEEVENPDVYWHNAWKMKIYRAVPYEGYHVRLSFLDEEPLEGENYYYVLVTQVNGQMAWSSPIWMRYNP
jgi:hypothetical protein